MKGLRHLRETNLGDTEIQCTYIVEWQGKLSNETLPIFGLERPINEGYKEDAVMTG